MAALHEGVFEYEVTARELAITLIRCVGTISRDSMATRPWPAEPGVPTPDGQMIGASTFAIGLRPCDGPDELLRDWERFALAIRAAVATGGDWLPATGTLLEVGGDAVLSSVRRKEGRLEVRLWNPSKDRGVRARVGGRELELGPARVETLRLGHALWMRAPVLAVGDGALGFWGAIDEVFPQTRHQRDWVHKAANFLDALPKSVQPQAKRAIAEITNAEDREHAEAVDRLVAEFGAKWPKAVDKILSDREALLAFYDSPAEHWGHLRTSNPIESTFSTVRARMNVTKGPGSREAGLAMAFKLLQAAEGRWRRVNAPELVALVRAGAKFVGGKLVERSEDEDAA